jgi:uncharacterized protein involved in exopolysaccharide biosynthesis
VLIDDLIHRAKRHWVFIAVGMLLGGIAGYASTWTKTPLYQAETVVAPANTRTAASGIAQLLQPLQGAARTALSLGDDAADLSERAVLIMRSRPFTESFVQSEGLVDLLTQPSRLDKLLGRPGVPPSLRVYAAARRFRTSISAVRVDGRTGFVTVAVRWSDPEAAAKWANDLTMAVNEEARRRAIADADSAITFLEQELEMQATVAIQAAINRLIESQLNTKMLAKTRPYYVYSVLSPAMPPPESEFVSPDRPLTALVVAIIGGILAFLVVLRWRV